MHFVDHLDHKPKNNTVKNNDDRHRQEKDVKEGCVGELTSIWRMMKLKQWKGSCIMSCLFHIIFGVYSTLPICFCFIYILSFFVLIICDPIEQKVHLVGQVYSEIMDKIVCKM